MPGEKPSEHLDRLVNGKPSLGVVCGDRQLGVRKECAKDGATERSWRLDKTPLDWTEDFVAGLITEQSKLTGVRVTRRVVRGRQCSWDLRATAPRDIDCVQLATTTEDKQQHIYWVLPSRPSRGAAWAREPMRNAGPFRFAKDTFHVTSKAQATPSADVQDADGKAISPPKRQAQEVRIREVPQGVEVVQVSADGNCFFQCLSEAIAFVRNGKPRDHSVLRAEIVAYQRKHAATFEAWWDRADSSGNELADFPAYLAHMQGNGVWAGPLEIESAARASNIEIFVVPRDGNLPPVVHNQGGPFRVALWFTGQHFDWLRPSAKDQGFPSAITNICSAPDMRSARGGGPEDAASVADSAWTIWTRDSQDRPVPLPKRPKAQPRPPISPPNGGSGRGPNSGQNSVGPDPHSRAEKGVWPGGKCGAMCHCQVARL